MAKTKVDGVIEAVHYAPDGNVAWVRAFERRGPTWSDRVLIDRKKLIGQIKNGKRFYSGKRLPYLAGTFEMSQLLQLQGQDGNEVLVIGEGSAERDHLEGVPVL